MKYKVCDKCGEVVTRTGIISTSSIPEKDGYFAQCHNKECGCKFSRSQYEHLEEKEF